MPGANGEARCWQVLAESDRPCVHRALSERDLSGKPAETLLEALHRCRPIQGLNQGKVLPHVRLSQQGKEEG